MTATTRAQWPLLWSAGLAVWAGYTAPMRYADPALRASIENALGALPALRLAIVFGSCAAGGAKAGSDLDLAVDAGTLLTPEQKIAMIDALATASGRPIDLVDLRACGEPLLGQILAHGRLVCGSTDTLADLMARHLLAQSDFAPYSERILAARRHSWIGQ